MRAECCCSRYPPRMAVDPGSKARRGTIARCPPPISQNNRRITTALPPAYLFNNIAATGKKHGSYSHCSGFDSKADLILQYGDEADDRHSDDAGKPSSNQGNSSNREAEDEGSLRYYHTHSYLSIFGERRREIQAHSQFKLQSDIEAKEIRLSVARQHPYCRGELCGDLCRHCPFCRASPGSLVLGLVDVRTFLSGRGCKRVGAYRQANARVFAAW